MQEGSLAQARHHAVENLVVFAPLAMAVHRVGLGTSATANAATLRFWSRLANALIDACGPPLGRTVAFVIAFGAQASLFLGVMGGR